LTLVYAFVDRRVRIEVEFSLLSSDFWRFACGLDEDGRSGRDLDNIEGVVSSLMNS
jgi:hypothetical protein